VVLPGELGFQAHFLASPEPVGDPLLADRQEISGAAAISGASAPVARLDTGETSPHVFESLEDARREKKEESCRRKRGYQAELVRLLEAMADGAHGSLAAALANKWLDLVRRCPGTVRRHGPCGRLSFHGHRCDFPLCPWCQARRTKKLVKRLRRVVGAMVAPKLWTFNGPNLPELVSEAVSDLGKALTALHRQAYFRRRCRGGVRSLEVTCNPGAVDALGRMVPWNLHAHEGVDSDWVAHYPQWDIVPRRGEMGQWLRRPWKVVERHPGLAREFTWLCQGSESLKSPRLDFDIDNPEHWYFVDVRVANVGVADELAKYVAKGSQVIRAGTWAVVAYLRAMKGKRLLQPFGSLYGVDFGDEEEPVEPPVREGECPYDDCPEPGRVDWKFDSWGYPDGLQLEHNLETGTSRLVPPSPT